MTRLIVTREDTGQILSPHGWTPDIQEARLFSQKSAASNAARAMIGVFKHWRRGDAPEAMPGLKHSEVVLVSAEDYAEIQEQLDKLNALEAAGVDNWEGYCYAMEILRGEADEEDSL